MQRNLEWRGKKKCKEKLERVRLGEKIGKKWEEIESRIKVALKKTRKEKKLGGKREKDD